MSKIISSHPATVSHDLNAAAHDARGAASVSFTTHNGERVTGARLQAALNAVADDWARNAHAIRAEDAYADHVTEATKDAILTKGLEFAETIRRGETKGFTTWQRINAKLTGECVALLA